MSVDLVLKMDAINEAISYYDLTFNVSLFVLFVSVLLLTVSVFIRNNNRITVDENSTLAIFRIASYCILGILFVSLIIINTEIKEKTIALQTYVDNHLTETETSFEGEVIKISEMDYTCLKNYSITVPCSQVTLENDKGKKYDTYKLQDSELSLDLNSNGIFSIKGDSELLKEVGINVNYISSIKE